MKLFFKTALVLGLICSISGAILVLVNNITSDRIELNEFNKLNLALNKVSFNNNISDKVEVTDNHSIDSYYNLMDFKTNSLKGYILSLKGNGYGGEISLLASYDTKGNIMAVELISNSETPGVGKKAENKGYMDKYIGKGSDIAIPLNKNQLSDPDKNLVSGATITFTSISKMLNEGSFFVKNLGEKNEY